MTISLIVAMDKNQVIGNQGALPWYLPEDLKYFKKKTLHSTVIMGRKTFESIGKPLPQRLNLVMTNQGIEPIRHLIPKDEAHMVAVSHSTTTPESWANYFNRPPEPPPGLGKSFPILKEPEAFVIGGREIFQAFYPYADRFYVTHIDHEFEGDTQWLEFSWDDWEQVSSEKGPKNEKNPYDYWFAVYERRKNNEI